MNTDPLTTSIDPATGDIIGTFPLHTAEDLFAAVARAREVQRHGPPCLSRSGSAM